MALRFFLSFILIFTNISCAKKEDQAYIAKEKIDPYILYAEGFKAFEKNDFFFANKKFVEAELNFDIPKYAAKSALMSSFCLYGINFYDEAEESLERYLTQYPGDTNIIYAHYLLAMIFFEQISDEKKDIEPILKAKRKINFFLEKYPNNEYATDLRFKKKLILSKLAAKELYVAKYYISVEKWVPAINRLKTIVEKYNETVFIEEALYRLVEIFYYLGVEAEAKKYASLLGYNYNSSEWFSKSYQILNDDYEMKKEVVKSSEDIKREKQSFFNRIIKIIK